MDFRLRPLVTQGAPVGTSVVESPLVGDCVYCAVPLMEKDTVGGVTVCPSCQRIQPTRS